MRCVLVGLALVVGTPTAAADERTYPDPRAVLIDPEVSPYRVHVGALRGASLTAEGPLELRADHQPFEPMEELIAVDERAGRVRVIADHPTDGVRVMAWLDARDLAWTLTREVRVAGRGDVGVWLRPGAPVTARLRGARARVSYRGEELALRGEVARDALDRVYRVDTGEEPADDDGELREVKRLRVAPGGALLHRRPLWVTVVSQRGAWMEVEHRSRHVRMRGWVGPQDIPDGGYGVCGCRGVGMRGRYAAVGAQRVTVDEGACLYDRAGGELVGVTQRRSERFTHRHQDSWWQILVDTPWGLTDVWAARLDDARGVWRRCDLGGRGLDR